MVAASRRCLLLGLLVICRELLVTGHDEECLVQRDITLFSPQAVSERPLVSLARVLADSTQQVAQTWQLVKPLLPPAVQVVFSLFEHGNALDYLQLGVGTGGRLEEVRVASIVNTSVTNYTLLLNELAYTLGEVGVRLTFDAMDALEDHCPILIERATYDAGDALALAASKFFAYVKILVDNFQTTGLKARAAAVVGYMTDNTAEKVYRQVSKGIRERTREFWANYTDICGRLSREIKPMNDMQHELKQSLPKTIKSLKSLAPTLEPTFRGLAPEVAEDFLKELNATVDDLKYAYSQLAVGVHLLVAQVADVVERKMHCTLGYTIFD